MFNVNKNDSAKRYFFQLNSDKQQTPQQMHTKIQQHNFNQLNQDLNSLIKYNSINDEPNNQFKQQQQITTTREQLQANNYANNFKKVFVSMSNIKNQKSLSGKNNEYFQNHTPQQSIVKPTSPPKQQSNPQKQKKQVIQKPSKNFLLEQFNRNFQQNNFIKSLKTRENDKSPSFEKNIYQLTKNLKDFREQRDNSYQKHKTQKSIDKSIQQDNLLNYLIDENTELLQIFRQHVKTKHNNAMINLNQNLFRMTQQNYTNEQLKALIQDRSAIIDHIKKYRINQDAFLQQTCETFNLQTINLEQLQKNVTSLQQEKCYLQQQQRFDNDEITQLKNTIFKIRNNQHTYDNEINEEFLVQLKNILYQEKILSSISLDQNEVLQSIMQFINKFNEIKDVSTQYYRQIQLLKNKSSTVSQQFNKLITYNENLETQLQSQQEQIQSLKSSRNKVQDENKFEHMKSVQDENISYFNQIQDLKEQVLICEKQSKQRINELNHQIEQKDAIINNKIVQIKDLQKQLEKQNIQYKDQIKSLKKSLKESQDLNQSLQGQYESYNTDSLQYKQINEKIIQIVSTKQESLADLESCIQQFAALNQNFVCNALEKFLQENYRIFKNIIFHNDQYQQTIQEQIEKENEMSAKIEELVQVIENQQEQLQQNKDNKSNYSVSLNDKNSINDINDEQKLSINQLQEQNNILVDLYEQQKQQIEELLEQRTQLRLNLQQLEQKVQQLEQQIETINNQNVQLNIKLNQKALDKQPGQQMSPKQHQTQQEQLQKLLKQTSQLQEDLNQYEFLLQNKQMDIDQLEAKLKSANQKANQFKQQLQYNSQQQQQNQDEIFNLKEKILNKDKEITQLLEVKNDKKLQEKSQEINQLINKIEEQTEQIQQKHQRNQKLQSKVTQLEKNLQENQQTIQQTNQFQLKIQEQKTIILQKDQDLNKLNKEITILQDQIDNLQNDLNKQQKNDGNEQFKKLKEELYAVKAKNQQQEQQITSLKQQLEQICLNQPTKLITQYSQEDNKDEVNETKMQNLILENQQLNTEIILLQNELNEFKDIAQNIEIAMEEKQKIKQEYQKLQIQIEQNNMENKLISQQILKQVSKNSEDLQKNRNLGLQQLVTQLIKSTLADDLKSIIKCLQDPNDLQRYKNNQQLEEYVNIIENSLEVNKQLVQEIQKFHIKGQYDHHYPIQEQIEDKSNNSNFSNDLQDVVGQISSNKEKQFYQNEELLQQAIHLKKNIELYLNALKQEKQNQGENEEKDSEMYLKIIESMLNFE